MHYQRKRTTGQVGGAEMKVIRYVEGAGEKACSKCKQVKPLDEFWAEPRKRDGRHSACKACTSLTLRDSTLRRKYGITAAEYDQMLADQGGACAVCEKPDPKRALVVDHCHRSTKVRALLCDRCNRLLGVVNDDRSLLEAAIRFLDRYQP